MLRLILFLGIVFPYSDNPPNEMVDAFQQNSCVVCHTNDPFMYDVNAFMEIDGLPNVIVPGETYMLDIMLYNTFSERWGFEIASFIGYGNGTNPIQAGNMNLVDSDDTVMEVENGISYIKQTESGSFSELDESMTWPVSWTAPDDYYGTVSFFASGVAGNNGTGNLGDFTYTTSITKEIIYESPNTTNIDYISDIQPIFNYYCLVCHNEEEQYNNNGLDLSTYEGTIEGGNSNSPVVPFDSEGSLLYQVIDHSIYPNDFGIAPMPYFSQQIPDHYIDMIKVWIEEGALEEFNCNSGDVNEDQELNVQDIIIIVSAILDDLLPSDLDCSDLNSDEAIDVLDIVQIINIILN